MLKILLIGLGSIGYRHLKILKEIGDIDIAALRTLKGYHQDKSGIEEFFTIEEAINFMPNGVIISNPTSLHVKTALPFLKQGIKLLIEKPVAHNVTESTLLLPYTSLVRVAYCFRFHPLNNVIKTVLHNEQPFKLGFKRSYYLPKWHPYADYRIEYTARKELGGGAIRTLSHEIDLMTHWFGIPDSIVGVTDKVSDLEITTDDYAFFSCGFKKGFRVNFELDFLSPININTGELFTIKGKYHWNMSGIWYTLYNETNPTLLKIFDKDNLDHMYTNQMKDFINFIFENKSLNTTLEEGIDVLKIIEQLDE